MRPRSKSPYRAATPGRQQPYPSRGRIDPPVRTRQRHPRRQSGRTGADPPRHGRGNPGDGRGDEPQDEGNELQDESKDADNESDGEDRQEEWQYEQRPNRPQAALKR